MRSSYDCAIERPVFTKKDQLKRRRRLNNEIVGLRKKANDLEIERDDSLEWYKKYALDDNDTE